MEQAGLRKGRWAREQIANVSDSWRAQGSNIKMSKSFIDYTKDFECAASENEEERKKCGNNQAFDTVDTRPTHRVRSQMQFHQGTTDWFPLQKGVKQGCILSPGLFDLYSEYIIM
jgi:hypothetical protein